MLRHLGIATRQAREEAGISPARIAAEADVSESTVRRFEAGQRWPKGGPDNIVSVYAQQTGVRPIDLWHRALALWAMDDEHA